jgi:hypothetical protein
VYLQVINRTGYTCYGFISLLSYYYLYPYYRAFYYRAFYYRAFYYRAFYYRAFYYRAFYYRGTTYLLITMTSTVTALFAYIAYTSI